MLRIRHAIVLEDPTDDPDMLAEHIPEASPEPAVDEVSAVYDQWHSQVLLSSYPNNCLL